MPCTNSNIINKFLCYRNLIFGSFGKRHSQSITYTVGEQSTNTYCALYASVLGITGFGNTKMQRISYTFLGHYTHKTAHSGNHH